MAANQAEAREQPMQRRVYSVATMALQNADVKTLPAPRGGATLTQVRSRDIYLIGGSNREAKTFGDVFKVDLEMKTWMAITPIEGSFPPRSGHSAIAIGDAIYVFGGMNPLEGEIFEDVYVFDTCTKRWTKPLVEGWMPGARNAQAAIRLPAVEGHDRILVHGGSSPDQGAFDDVYILHIGADDPEAPLRWERRECTGSEIPEARELHVASFLTPTTILFSGGRNKDGNVCTDMAVLDIETWQWQLIPICEWNRCSHAAGAVDGIIVSFGGFDGSAIRDDCWEYADNEESWLRVETLAVDKDKGKPESTPLEPVAPRFGHGGCVVELPAQETGAKGQQGLLVFGGMNAERDLNDLVLITPTAHVS